MNASSPSIKGQVCRCVMASLRNGMGTDLLLPLNCQPTVAIFKLNCLQTITTRRCVVVVVVPWDLDMYVRWHVFAKSRTAFYGN